MAPDEVAAFYSVWKVETFCRSPLKLARTPRSRPCAFAAKVAERRRRRRQSVNATLNSRDRRGELDEPFKVQEHSKEDFNTRHSYLTASNGLLLAPITSPPSQA